MNIDLSAENFQKLLYIKPANEFTWLSVLILFLGLRNGQCVNSTWAYDPPE